MLGLYLSLWLAGAPTPTLSQTQLELEPPTQIELPRRRLSKGQRLVIGSSAAYGVGSAIQWATVGGAGILDDARPGGSSPVVMGMNLGGMAMFGGLVVGALAGSELARESQGHDRRAKPMLAGGAVVASIGGGALLGSALLWPTLRDNCPIGGGCALAGIHLGGAVLSVGTGMMAYGHRLLQRDPNHHDLSKRAKSPLLAGAVLFGMGYVMAAGYGLGVWQENRDDERVIRTRNRMLVPVVGPWIHAAGPDAPLFEAMATGVFGALQIAGALALVAGGVIAGSEQRRWHERVQVAIAPRLDGISIVGRF